MTTWLFILDHRYPSGRNMERDLELFQEVKSGKIDGSLRIYNWDEPAVTIGYHQRQFKPHTKELDIRILRRPTGGGAVLHKDDITYSISAPLQGILASGILENYAAIARVFAHAFSRCGLDARIEGSDRNYAPICFSRTSPVELVVDGMKIMGSAQMRREGFFLQQGVIPLEVDRSLSMEVFGPQPHLPVGIKTFLPGFQTGLFIEELKSALGAFLDINFTSREPPA
jgi:lipoate-protein ligase A